MRDDRYLDHNWGLGSPAPGVIGNDFFSARWTKTLNSTPGLYHLLLTSDDGARLYINNQLVIDNWSVQSATTKAADYHYPGGPVDIRVEYFENTENASIEVHLGLKPEGSAEASQPVVIQSAGPMPEAVRHRWASPPTLMLLTSISVMVRQLQFPTIATLPQCDDGSINWF